MYDTIEDSSIRNKLVELQDAPQFMFNAAEKRDIDKLRNDSLNLRQRARVLQKEIQAGRDVGSFNLKPIFYDFNWRNLLAVTEVVTADYVRELKNFFQFIPGEETSVAVEVTRFKAYLVYLGIQFLRETGIFEFDVFKFPLIQQSDQVAVPFFYGMYLQLLRPVDTVYGKMQFKIERPNFQFSAPSIWGETYDVDELHTPALPEYQGTSTQFNGIYTEIFQERTPDGVTAEINEYIIDGNTTYTSVTLDDFVTNELYQFQDGELGISRFNSIVTLMPHVAFSDLKPKGSSDFYALGARRGTGTEANLIINPIPVEDDKNLWQVVNYFNPSRTDLGYGTNTIIRKNGMVDNNLNPTNTQFAQTFALLETYQACKDRAPYLVQVIKDGSRIRDKHIFSTRFPNNRGGFQKKAINPTPIHKKINATAMNDIVNEYCDAVTAQLNRSDDTESDTASYDPLRYMKALKIQVQSFVINKIKRTTPTGLLSPNFGSVGVGYDAINTHILAAAYEKVLGKVIDAGAPGPLAPVIYPAFIKEDSLAFWNYLASDTVANFFGVMFAGDVVISDKAPLSDDPEAEVEKKLILEKQKEEDTNVCPLHPNHSRLNLDISSKKQSEIRSPSPGVSKVRKAELMSIFRNGKFKKGMSKEDLKKYPAVDVYEIYPKVDLSNEKNMQLDYKDPARTDLIEFGPHLSKEQIYDIKKCRKGRLTGVLSPESVQRVSNWATADEFLLDLAWIQGMFDWQTAPGWSTNIIPDATSSMFDYLVDVEAGLKMLSVLDSRSREFTRGAGGPGMRTQVSGRSGFFNQVATRDTDSYNMFFFDVQPVRISSPRNMFSVEFQFSRNMIHQIDYFVDDGDSDPNIVTYNNFNNRIAAGVSSPYIFKTIAAYLSQENGPYIRDVQTIKQKYHTFNFDESFFGLDMQNEEDCKLGALFLKLAKNVGGTVSAGVKAITSPSFDSGIEAVESIVRTAVSAKDFITGIADALDHGGEIKKVTAKDIKKEYDVQKTIQFKNIQEKQQRKQRQENKQKRDMKKAHQTIEKVLNGNTSEVVRRGKRGANRVRQAYQNGRKGK